LALSTSAAVASSAAPVAVFRAKAPLTQAIGASRRAAFLPSDRWAEISVTGGAGADQFHARKGNGVTLRCQAQSVTLVWKTMAPEVRPVEWYDNYYPYKVTTRSKLQPV